MAPRRTSGPIFVLFLTQVFPKDGLREEYQFLGHLGPQILHFGLLFVKSCEIQCVQYSIAEPNASKEDNNIRNQKYQPQILENVWRTIKERLDAVIFHNEGHIEILWL